MSIHRDNQYCKHRRWSKQMFVFPPLSLSLPSYFSFSLSLSLSLSLLTQSFKLTSTLPLCHKGVRNPQALLSIMGNVVFWCKCWGWPSSTRYLCCITVTPTESQCQCEYSRYVTPSSSSFFFFFFFIIFFFPQLVMCFIINPDTHCLLA